SASGERGGVCGRRRTAEPLPGACVRARSRIRACARARPRARARAPPRPCAPPPPPPRPPPPTPHPPGCAPPTPHRPRPLPPAPPPPPPTASAVHGNSAAPEAQWSAWPGIVGDRAFVLCPRGIARDGSPSPDDVRFTFASSEAVAQELAAATAALRARFPDFV